MLKIFYTVRSFVLMTAAYFIDFEGYINVNVKIKSEKKTKLPPPRKLAPSLALREITLQTQ